MKVKYIGFGGYMEVPCYQDENGKIYFDENNGRNGLNLYTGAYMDCGEICGEPCNRVTEPVECEKPFVRSSKEREYMLLNRLQLDGRNLKADRNLKQFMQLALLVSCYKKFGLIL